MKLAMRGSSCWWRWYEGSWHLLRMSLNFRSKSLRSQNLMLVMACKLLKLQVCWGTITACI